MHAFDVKIIHSSTSSYTSARARDEQGGAVVERAYRVIGEYVRHARRLDTQYSPQGATPVEDRLGSLGDVRGLVFGQYGETSPDVDALLSAAADGVARRIWLRYGARSQSEARSFAVASIRRRLGVFVVREMARHRLRRAMYVGVPRSVVERAMRVRREAVGEQLAGSLGAPPSVAPLEDFLAHQAYIPLRHAA